MRRGAEATRQERRRAKSKRVRRAARTQQERSAHANAHSTTIKANQEKRALGEHSRRLALTEGKEPMRSCSETCEADRSPANMRADDWQRFHRFATRTTRLLQNRGSFTTHCRARHTMDGSNRGNEEESGLFRFRSKHCAGHLCSSQCRKTTKRCRRLAAKFSKVSPHPCVWALRFNPTLLFGSRSAGTPGRAVCIHGCRNEGIFPSECCAFRGANAQSLPCLLA